MCVFVVSSSLVGSMIALTYHTLDGYDRVLMVTDGWNYALSHSVVRRRALEQVQVSKCDTAIDGLVVKGG